MSAIASWPHEGLSYAQSNYVPWNGCHICDVSATFDDSRRFNLASDEPA